MTVAVILGALFTLIGGAIIKFSIDAAFQQYHFQFTDTEFRCDTYYYGKKRKEQHLPIAGIEDFGVRDSTQRRGSNTVTVGGFKRRRYQSNQGKPELFARSDSKIIIVRRLTLEQAEFLRNLFYQKLGQR